jgi:pullulanase/glycogen debranching enzyme
MPNAYWLARETFCWNIDDLTDDVEVVLHHDPNGTMFVTSEGMIGGSRVELVRAAPISGALLERFPHLREQQCWTAFLRGNDVRRMLRGQIALAAYRDGELIDVASIQAAGVIDELLSYDGPLGVTITEEVTLALWAPTARKVRLHLFLTSAESEPSRTIELDFDETHGVWSASFGHDVLGLFYLYEVDVYVRTTGSFELNLVTDPYSVSLGLNSTKSQIADLNAAAIVPDGWSNLTKPPLQRLEDSVIYELHVRDFSSADESVPPLHRARYAAFGDDTHGTCHLKRLADAGVTHLHLLPINDFASAEDERRDYNWGYDPLHWLVPEGSYAIEPDGAARTREVREMVSALNALGLRVVVDVVFNHTYASGQHPLSVLDRIVPGYYHRLDEDGVVAASTCCANTATEHTMMERLMIDAVLLWARAYKVDGFRFDLMGHHLLRNMTRLRDAVRALTLERDGVDGASMLLYGEGWDFGEVAHNARGRNASQMNIAGHGIGTFNDRLRDGVRGGNPFGEPLVPGFTTGLSDEFAGYPSKLRDNERRIESGMAAALRQYPIVGDDGNEYPAFDVDRIGYALTPLDAVNYVAAHDNETLFDIIQMKGPDHWTSDERVRMNNLSVSVIALAQGIPFFHAGDELLRSKSCDHNSYRSGDIINRIDFSGQNNNWAVEMPVSKEDPSVLRRIEAVFGNRNTFVSPAQIEFAVEHFCEMLRIRRSSQLFRLDSATRIIESLRFHDRHALGVCVMSLSDLNERLLVVFNARPIPYEETLLPDFSSMQLHPVLQKSHDEVVRGAKFVEGRVSVPPRTTAVFVNG